jgi:hypothetical protein
MSMAQKQTNKPRSQYICETEKPAAIPLELNNNFLPGTNDSTATLSSEILDIARLLAKIAVDNYFSETKPSNFA